MADVAYQNVAQIRGASVELPLVLDKRPYFIGHLLAEKTDERGAGGCHVPHLGGEDVELLVAWHSPPRRMAGRVSHVVSPPGLRQEEDRVVVPNVTVPSIVLVPTSTDIARPPDTAMDIIHMSHPLTYITVEGHFRVGALSGKADVGLEFLSGHGSLGHGAPDGHVVYG